MDKPRADLANEQARDEVDGRYTQGVEGGVVKHLGNGRLKGRQVEVFRFWSWQDWLADGLGLETANRDETLED